MSAVTPNDAGQLRVGLIGAGSWGRNYVRVLSQLGVLAAVCDAEAQVLANIKEAHPGLQVADQVPALLQDPELDAVVIAAPAAQHYELARAALNAGKHCLIEKPLATSAAGAAELCALAEARGLTLMSAHILLYHPAVTKLKQLVDQGHFGQIYYISSTRANLGMIRRQEGVLQSLGPHDISIARYLLGGEPASVSATAGCYVQRESGICDVANVTLEFSAGARASLALSWLDPEKVRTVKLVGSERMALFDDMQPRYKLQIHEKGVDWNQFLAGPDSSFLKVRSGDVQSPFISPAEPLLLECREFVSAISEQRQPLTPGTDGLAVARILAAAEASVAHGGAPVALDG